MSLRLFGASRMERDPLTRDAESQAGPSRKSPVWTSQFGPHIYRPAV